MKSSIQTNSLILAVLASSSKTKLSQARTVESKCDVKKALILDNLVKEQEKSKHTA